MERETLPPEAGGSLLLEGGGGGGARSSSAYSDVAAVAAAGTVQDPSFTLTNETRNLMWGAGGGPGSYDPSLGLLGNFQLTSAQIDAAIYNGLRLDPDGNGVGVLRLVAVPEPSAAGLAVVGCLLLPFRRRRQAAA